MNKELQEKKGFICDMDGVIYHGNMLLDGVKEFVEWLYENDKEFLFLTNASSRSPRELREKLLRMGLDIREVLFRLAEPWLYRNLKYDYKKTPAIVTGVYVY